MHIGKILWIPVIDPKTFGTNPSTIEGPHIHVTKASGGERLGTNTEKVGRKRVRCWEYPCSAAYAPEFA
jgi:hypothetical protein